MHECCWLGDGRKISYFLKSPTPLCARSVTYVIHYSVSTPLRQSVRKRRGAVSALIFKPLKTTHIAFSKMDRTGVHTVPSTNIDIAVREGDAVRMKDKVPFFASHFEAVRGVYRAVLRRRTGVRRSARVIIAGREVRWHVKEWVCSARGVKVEQSIKVEHYGGKVV